MQKKKGNGKKHNAISPNLQKLCNFNNAKNKLGEIKIKKGKK